MKSNLIINILLKVKSFYLSLIEKVKSLVQRQDQNKNNTSKTEDDQQHKSTMSEDESVDLCIENEESEIWFDAQSELESEIDEDEFFDALSSDEYSDYVSENEGYISSNSQGKSTSVKNIVIENDQYYSIDGLQKKTSLSSYDNDILALAFSGEASEKISSGKYNLTSLHYNEHIKTIELTDSIKSDNIFKLNANSFNIYILIYICLHTSKTINQNLLQKLLVVIKL